MGAYAKAESLLQEALQIRRLPFVLRLGLIMLTGDNERSTNGRTKTWD
jgi:hypothetical protein